MTRTYENIKETLESLSYKFFDSGDFNVNSVWERTSDVFTNKFTDFWHLAFRENNVPKVVTIKASTKAGLKGAVLNPLTVDGVKGTAVILEGQYLSAWSYVDKVIASTNPNLYQFFFNINKYSQSEEVPYLMQIKPVNYLRDGDKDENIDRKGDVDKDGYDAVEQDNKGYGTHCHLATEPLNNWSLGCMTFPEKDFMTNFDPVLRKMVALWGRNLSQSIIKTENFK